MSNYTIGELENMDLRELHDQHFMVAVNSGDRNENKYICETICGPVDFYEMCSIVGHIIEEQMLHAKVFICEKEFGNPPKFLDEDTVDYIEAKYQDIIMHSILDGTLEEDYTCKAGFITEKQNESNVSAR